MPVPVEGCGASSATAPKGPELFRQAFASSDCFIVLQLCIRKKSVFRLSLVVDMQLYETDASEMLCSILTSTHLQLISHALAMFVS